MHGGLLRGLVVRDVEVVVKKCEVGSGGSCRLARGVCVCRKGRVG